MWMGHLHHSQTSGFLPEVLFRIAPLPHPFRSHRPPPPLSTIVSLPYHEYLPPAIPSAPVPAFLPPLPHSTPTREVVQHSADAAAGSRQCPTRHLRTPTHRVPREHKEQGMDATQTCIKIRLQLYTRRIFGLRAPVILPYRSALHPVPPASPPPPALPPRTPSLPAVLPAAPQPRRLPPALPPFPPLRACPPAPLLPSHTAAGLASTKKKCMLSIGGRRM